MSSGGGSGSDGGSTGGASQRGTIDRSAPTGISGPAGGASAHGNYGGDSSGGFGANEMGGNTATTGDRIQRIAKGQEPGYRADDSRPFGLSKEEAYRQGKITVNQRDADPELTEQHERDVTRDLDFDEHWNLAPESIKWSPTLRFLYASGKNLGEWAESKGWNFNNNTGNFTDNSGGN